MHSDGVKGKESGFSDRLGFILASAGSAVGLGNIWRFPYLAAKYGGGIFLLTYLILAVTVGFSLSLAEVALGRKTGRSSATAFGSLDRRFSFLGYLNILVPILVIPYYSVVGGWVVKYAVSYIVGEGSALAADGYFEGYTKGVVEPLAFFLIFAVVTVLTVLLGVKGGVEKISKLLMPPLLILTVFIAVFTVATTEGSLEGVKYYLLPNFESFSVMTVVAALGQLFYSMSIAMGTLVTFGSYTSREIDIEKSVRYVEIFDTGIAFLSGFMIIPAVFAFFGESAAHSEGAPLMFITLPKIFVSMPMGGVIGAVFFIMVTLAALTSNIALAEAFVAMIADRFRIKRKTALLVSLAVFVILGIPSALGYGVLGGVKLLGLTILELFDFLASNLLMPVIALFTVIFIGYVIKPKALIDEIEESGRFKHKRLFTTVIRYLAPPIIGVILVTSFLELFGVIKI